jgi:D-serine deaminase-like pyridoxal phosphate-dependent protein
MNLSTPALVVDLDKMEANIRKWQEAIGKYGVALRPHVKTHKIPDIAKRQLAAGASGITVAKVAEAEVFAAHGCDDIFIAYPVIGPDKWQRAAQLAKRMKLIVGVESEVGVRGLSDAAAQAGATALVRVEVDTGLNRSGIQPSQTEALCKLILSLPGLELDGIFTYRSASFAGAGNHSPHVLGIEEGEIMVRIAEHLRGQGIPIHHISGGSTPTAQAFASVSGVTEARPGTYIFSDYMQAGRGIVSYDDVALTIYCTVISVLSPTKFTVDGGSKTFCGDIAYRGTDLKGYGKLIGKEVYVDSLSEEHGVVRCDEPMTVNVGDVLAFHPVHVCTTVNLSDELIGVRNGIIENVWPVLARGKRT